MGTKFVQGVLFAVLLFYSGCGGSKTLPQPAITNLTPAQANELLQGKNPPQLVDVRNADEYQAGHIPGAKLIPLPDLEKRLVEIDKGKPVLLYCLAGVRSQKAANLLNQRGFQNVSQIAGGIKAWKGMDLPTTTAAP